MSKRASIASERTHCCTLIEIFVSIEYSVKVFFMTIEYSVKVFFMTIEYSVKVFLMNNRLENGLHLMVNEVIPKLYIVDLLYQTLKGTI